MVDDLIAQSSRRAMKNRVWARLQTRCCRPMSVRVLKCVERLEREIIQVGICDRVSPVAGAQDEATRGGIRG